MRPFLLALLTAAAWGVGGFFEKKGLHLGNLPPQVGATLRTAVALLVLLAVSAPQLRALREAPPRALWAIALGGGVAAGALGVLCFYAALKSAPLARVMPVAFTSPLFGAAVAILAGGETPSARTLAGMLLTVGGIIVLTGG